jgi:hypothetical protein
MRARFNRIAAFTGAAAMGMAIMAGTAVADTRYNDCHAGGDILTGWTEYNLASQNTVYVSRAGFNLERNGGMHNNVYLRLRGNGGNTTYWSWTSGDDVVGGRDYAFSVQHRVPRGSKPYMKYNATFDQNGPDPSCAAYTNLPR